MCASSQISFSGVRNVSTPLHSQALQHNLKIMAVPQNFRSSFVYLGSSVVGFDYKENHTEFELSVTNVELSFKRD